MSFTRPQKRAGTGRSPRITTRIAVGLMAIALGLTGVGAPIASAQDAGDLHTIQFETPADWRGNLDGYEFTTEFDTGHFLLLTIDSDGIADVLAVDHDGVLWLYRGKAKGGLSSASKLGSGWAGLEVSAPGDFNGDGKVDVLAKAANGDLFFYAAKEGGFRTAVQVGSGW